jgi:hypothetical protein
MAGIRSAVLQPATSQLAVDGQIRQHLIVRPPRDNKQLNDGLVCCELSS